MKPMVYGFLLIVAAMTVACNDSGNTTNVVNGLDCGLIRADLVGDWIVDLGPGSPTLQNCTGSDTGLNGTTVGTNDFSPPATYANVDVFGSDGSSSFKVLSDRTDVGADPAIDAELTGTVQADSCLAMVRVWDATDALYFQCIGTLTISNGTMSGSCDSAEIDSDANDQLDTSCSLSTGVTFSAGIQ